MKKGFTLVELLAVIVVLALITLITVPIVSDTIDKNENSALERSTELYLKSVEQAIVEKNIGSEGIYEVKECTINNKGNLLCDNSTEEIVIEASGNRPDDGKIKFKEGKIYSYILMFDDKEFSQNYIEIVNDTTYPWMIDGENYNSSNHEHNSTSNLTFKFKATKQTALLFEWSVSSQSVDYDYLYYTIKKDGTTLSDTGTSTKIGGTSYVRVDKSVAYESVFKILEPGEYELIFTYTKDGSSHSGDDMAYVKNVEINTIEEKDIIQIVEDYIEDLNDWGLHYGRYSIHPYGYISLDDSLEDYLFDPSSNQFPTDGRFITSNTGNVIPKGWSNGYFTLSYFVVDNKYVYYDYNNQLTISKDGIQTIKKLEALEIVEQFIIDVESSFRPGSGIYSIANGALQELVYNGDIIIDCKSSHPSDGIVAINNNKVVPSGVYEETGKTYNTYFIVGDYKVSYDSNNELVVTRN